MLNKKNTLIFISIWIFVISLLRIFQYFSFGTNTFDFAIFDYAFYNTLHGKLFFEPFHGQFVSHLGVHFTPSLLLLLPIYAIFQHPLTLLLLQVFSIGLSAYFLLKISLSYLDEKKSFFVVVIFLLFRQLLSATMYDFHPIAFFPLLFFLFYNEMLGQKRPLIYLTILLLIFGLKEDMALYMIIFGIVLFLRYDKRAGILVFLLSLFYFPLVYFVIQPSFYHGEGFYLFSHWSHLGNSFTDVVKNLLTNPLIIFKLSWFSKSLLKLFNYFAPFLFLIFFSIDIIPILIPLLVLITSANEGMHNLSLHFALYLIPFVFISFIKSINYIEKKIKNKNIVFGIVLVILLINLGNSSIYKLLNPERYKNIKYYKYVKFINKEMENFKNQKLYIQNSIIPVLKKNNNFQMLSKKNMNKKNIIVIVNPHLNPWPLSKNDINELINTKKIIKILGDFYFLKL